MGKIAILEVLKVPAFRSLWLSQVFSQTAINLLTFVLALRVYHLTGKNTAVSILILSFVVPQALFGLLAGVLVDRYDKKAVLFFCNFVRAMVVIFFLSTSEALPFIYVLAILISLATQFFVPAEAPIIPTLVSKKELLTANGVFTMTIFVAMLLGGLLAGPFLDMFGINITFLLISFMYIFASFYITRIPGQAIKKILSRRLGYWVNRENWSNLLDGGTMTRIRQELLEGKNYIMTHDKVLLALLLLVGSQTIIASTSTLLPGLADKVLHLPINDASVILLGPAILGIMAGAVTISQLGRKWKPSRVISVGIGLLAANLIILGILNNRIVVQVLLFSLGFSNALIDVSANTILQRNTQEEVRSRVYGVLAAMGGVIFILPVILSGTLSDFLGVGKTFTLAGLLIAALFFIRIRQELEII